MIIVTNPVNRRCLQHNQSVQSRDKDYTMGSFPVVKEMCLITNILILVLVPDPINKNYLNTQNQNLHKEALYFSR